MSKMRGSSGFATVTAIFLIVVLSALAVAGVALLRGAQSDASLDWRAAQAREAAQMMLEHAFVRVRLANQANCSKRASGTQSYNHSAASPFPHSLQGFTVTVTTTCRNDGASIEPTYRFVVVACSPATGSCPRVPLPAALSYVEYELRGHCFLKDAATPPSCRIE